MLPDFFTQICDELVEIADYDHELKESLKWIDEQAQKRGISFYDMVFQVLYKFDIQEKAKKWNQSRN